ncbi:small nuclear ribonucleoprotein (snRNP)-like protein [Oikeobacillus pervagus]|uniref:Small nuclear ribonucleoprotein (SnRNP)-like protein n=1 Tax=Oikeobacillus pervagus TaxID=1325931 RepID=A0AAJ1SWM3_9BACI|nr:hypothetical protein [Oikeobacillus pervagus]MDQ0213994.1 small nuclear ribonucleoprotein (snRNP)-like protein [Oikeobacillus pervagus]
MTENHNEIENREDLLRNLHEKCRNYRYHHVIMTTHDGRSFDGIIESVDRDHMKVLVGEDIMEREHDEMDDRQFYGFPRRRGFRRYRRRIFPLASLAAVALLPYFLSYPYYPYPYYPYPPFYPYY